MASHPPATGQFACQPVPRWSLTGAKHNPSHKGVNWVRGKQVMLQSAHERTTQYLHDYIIHAHIHLYHRTSIIVQAESFVQQMSK